MTCLSKACSGGWGLGGFGGVRVLTADVTVRLVACWTDSMEQSVSPPHPTPYTLHPTPYTLHPVSYTSHPTPSQLDLGVRELL